MGRPPCCDKEGVKKGPWTPEEDIILVSYVQDHGPGNWRAVPAKTGKLRRAHQVWVIKLPCESGCLTSCSGFVRVQV